MPKILLMRSGFPSFLILAVSLWGAVGHAWAERADRAQPLVFAADAARVDEARRLNILSGNVEITKGSMVVRADKVEVRQNSSGSQSAVATGGAGGRAYFRQKREGVNEFIEGEAQTIEYDGKADTVRFVQKAQLRRYRGATLADQVTGAVIVYDNTRDLFTVDGAPRQGNAPGTGGRVRAMLSPKPEAGNALAPAPATLRPSTSLPGAPQ